MAHKGPTLGLIAAVLAAIGALSAADVFLARMQNREVASQARSDYDAGTRLLAENRPGDAVDALRKAHSLDRTNSPYELQLADALLKDAKLDEAAAMLADLLERTPNNSEANLLEARLMARQGKSSEATSYYHRAIYGIWRNDARSRTIQARLELANFLVSHGSRETLLADLLPLEAEAQNDPVILKQVAHLYLVAGSPPRAGTVYSGLIRANPKDFSNYAGLGDDELAMGDYRRAQTAFQNALRRGAPQNELRPRVQLAETAAGLDPTPRSLSSAEKLRRSDRILQLARDALTLCANAPGQAQKIADADKLLKMKVRAPTNELAEQRLSMAEDLWRTRNAACGASASPDREPLRLILSKLAQ